MPKAQHTQSGLLDTWGRRNRKHQNRDCPHCGKTFKPLKRESRYCSRRCMWANNGGHNKTPEMWWTNQGGYIEGKMWLPNGTQIRVKQHHFIVEGILGRPLKSDEDVHHINGVKNDNRPENLQVLNHSDHSRQTSARRKYKKGYSLKLTKEAREARSLRAIAINLGDLGRAAKAKAAGKDGE